MSTIDKSPTNRNKKLCKLKFEINGNNIQVNIT